MSLLTVQNLGFHYSGQPTLFSDLNCTLQPGQILTILGPNGVGKSTFLKCLMGILKPTSGSISLADQPLSQQSVRQRAQQVAYVPQHVPDPGSLTVSDYVVTGRTPYLPFSQTPGAQDYEKVQVALKEFGLGDYAQRRVNTLSGGQFQLITIAKALVQEPRLVILDEPTAALDFGRQRQVLKLIQSMAGHHFAVIHTTHNPNHAFMLGNTVGLFAPDGSFETGQPDELLTEERLRATYQTPLKLIYEPALKRTVCELL
ncbi:ABC transporter ATP-binding protein [Secundilactobacillus folii]|uniref:ATP-binding cassette domain-containing protein n=1 Tax=Secundilactobacillus folii TaxID=2678357 RepID=A0A7X2XV45_9LACO|nr:ABC transporter ATP-binding protein [Secundilactobacillus folii]MTV82188.1 ATP-binding cassette domain-containing protein [Secundilactobacillus folii]